MNKVTCPICRQPMKGSPKEWPEFPFCCSRCKLIDLGRWLGEEYVVAPEADEESDREVDDADLPP